MESLAFLGVAAGIVLIGCLLVWLRFRERPTSQFDSIDEFRREMDRLAPPDDPSSNRPRRP